MSARVSGFANPFGRAETGRNFLDSFSLNLRRGTIVFPQCQPGGLRFIPAPLTRGRVPEFLYTMASAGGGVSDLFRKNGFSLSKMRRDPWVADDIETAYATIGERAAQLLRSHGWMSEAVDPERRSINGRVQWKRTRVDSEGSIRDLTWHLALEGKQEVTEDGFFAYVNQPPLARVAVGRKRKGLRVMQEVGIGFKGRLGTTQLLLQFDESTVSGLRKFLGIPEGPFFDLFLGLASCVAQSGYHTSAEVKEWLLGRGTYGPRNLNLSRDGFVVLSDIPDRMKRGPCIRSRHTVATYYPPDDYLGGDASESDIPLATISGSAGRDEGSGSFTVELHDFYPTKTHSIKPVPPRLLKLIEAVWGRGSV